MKDPVLLVVYQLTQHRWPHERWRVPWVVRYYWDFRDEGLLLQELRLVIPAELPEEYLHHLNVIYEQPRYTRCETIPVLQGIDADSTDYILRCQECIKRRRPAEEPLQPHDVAESFWRKVVMDHWLLICDYCKGLKIMVLLLCFQWCHSCN